MLYPDPRTPQGNPIPLMQANAPTSHASFRTVSINGVVIAELTTGVAGSVSPDGGVREQEHVAYVQLRDGTITDDIRKTAQCHLCAAEMDAEGDRLTDFEKLIGSRCDPAKVRTSDLSNIPLCPYHQVRVPVDGREMVLSAAEADHLRARGIDLDWIRMQALLAPTEPMPPQLT